MARTLAVTTALARSNDADHDDRIRSAATDLTEWLSILRRAMTDTGWTADALDAHWGTSRGYASKLLNQDKPWSVARMLSLPRDLRARLGWLELEQFGLIVVEPADGSEAVRQFAAGLIGLFASQLPARATNMARATVVARNVASKVVSR